MQEQNIKTALEKLRAQKLRRIDLHKLLEGVDRGMEDAEIAKEFNMAEGDVRVIRQVLRE